MVDKLNSAADKLSAVAIQLQQEATNYTEIATAFTLMANRFLHLSNLDVDKNQERSYIDTTVLKTVGISLGTSPIEKS